MAPCFCLLIGKYIMGENMGEEVKKNESWDARWLTIPAVSYTHLDVYKRQMQG